MIEWMKKHKMLTGCLGVVGFIFVIFVIALIDVSNDPVKEQQKTEQFEDKQLEKEVDLETVIKYQCVDGSIVDDLADCPKEIKKEESEPSIPQTFTFKGGGNQITDKFYLIKGLVIFRSNYEGESNFMVDLIDSEGKFVDIVANEIGTSESSSATSIRNEGYYRLEVKGWTDSRWEIKVEQ